LTVYEEAIIEINEMKGYDIEEIDERNYIIDRITQRCEKILRERRSNAI
jgi:hypothetical protein